MKRLTLTEQFPLHTFKKCTLCSYSKCLIDYNNVILAINLHNGNLTGVSERVITKIKFQRDHFKTPRK